jgi:hypothetical protein
VQVAKDVGAVGLEVGVEGPEGDQRGEAGGAVGGQDAATVRS